MKIGKIAAFVATSAMAVATPIAQAQATHSLSLQNSPASAPMAAPASRASAKMGKSSKIAVLSPLFIVLGLISTVAVLEITGAIDIIDDSPDSP